MFLKKIMIPLQKLSSYEFTYDDETDLKLGIEKMLSMLKSDKFIVQVFLKDEINSLIKKGENYFNYKNYTIYMLDDLEFLKKINFFGLRYMTIYGLEEDVCYNNDIIQMIKQCSFMIEFDNYLEVSNIKIDFSRYEDKIVKEFMQYVK